MKHRLCREWVAAGLVGLLAIGCGSERTPDNAFTEDAGSDARPGEDATIISFTEGGVLDGDTVLGIEIKPLDPVLNANGAPVSQQFQAFAKGTTNALAALWATDNAAIGAIDANTGLFKASGVTGGVSNVIAQYGKLMATTTVTVKATVVDANGVSAQDQQALKGGGPLSNDAAFAWLYPYDATVFPRGLRAPQMQFGGVAPDKVYVHVESKFLSYDAFFGASNPGRVTLDEARWKSITDSAGGSDKVTVRITKMSGTTVTGPIQEKWTVAPGNLKGTVYYNTYSTPQGASGQGALLKVRPGSTVDAQVLLGGCTVCHSVSANGNVIASGISWATGNPLNSGTFKVDADGGTSPMFSQPLGQYAFGGLTPDGTYMMSNEVARGGIRGLSGGEGSSVFDTATGAKKAAPGWDGVVTNAQMPSFSPDGKFIVFNNRDTSTGHILTTMAFNQPTLTFSGQSDVWTDPANLLAWPAFLPDSKAVVFHAGSDFGTQHSTAEIEIADVAAKTMAKLPALNGYAGTDTTYGATYLPYGEAAEAHMNFEPTVLPVAVGGYYWVIFTSRRCYGNNFTPAQDPWALDSGQPELSPRKKLWVAAVDINPTPGQDRSHPAFYLPGQELLTGNMRAFWALDPCKSNGITCETGDECCGGFCRSVTEPDGGVHRLCNAAPMGCAQELDKCTTTGDCCGAPQGFQCINGHCAQPAPK